MICLNVRNLKVGDPRDASTFVGALISKEHMEKVKGYIELARKEGHKILCGDDPLDLPPANQKVCNLLVTRFMTTIFR